MATLALPFITLPGSEARAKLAEYRRALAEAGPEAPAADRLLAQAFYQLARGKTLLSLTDAMRAGGTEAYEFAARGWTDGGIRPVSEERPRLAIAAADSAEVHLRMEQEGDHTVVCFTRDNPWAVGRAEAAWHRDFLLHGQRNTVSKDGHTVIVRWDRHLLAHRAHRVRPAPPLFKALTPSVPPGQRPHRARLPRRSLTGYHILWEAEWRVSQPPPPRDPLLLKHVGGDLFVVVSQWDLTAVEQAVLAAARR